MKGDNNRGMRDWLFFIRVSETGSFSKAARELSVSTAAISKAIFRIEDYLGVILFTRNPDGVTLTDAGHTALLHAQGITQSFRALLDDLRNPNNLIKGSIHLTAPAVVCEFMANEWIYEYTHKHPESKIFLDSREKADLHRESPEFDDLVLRSGRIESEDLVHRQLKPIKLVLCASPEYLKQHPPIRHPSDLLNHQFFNLHHHGLSGPLVFHKEDEAVTIDTFSSTGLSSNNLLSLLNLVIKGRGISLATPGWLASGYIKTGNLQVILPEWRLPELPVWLVWRQRPRYSPLFIDFRDFVTEKWNGRPQVDQLTVPIKGDGRLMPLFDKL